MDKNIIDNVLNNTASPEQAKQVAKWFATPEGQKDLTLRMDAERDDVDISDVDVLNIERVYKNIETVIHQRKNRRRVWMVAATLIPLFIVSAWMVFMISRVGIFSSAEYAEIVVENGDRIQVILQDGSKVHLNSGTTFRYPIKFGMFERKVYLDGQGYFNVKSDSSYPFIIDVNGANVNVTGTSFDVEAYKNQDYIILSLDKGRVSLESKDKQYNLQPKQQLIYNRFDLSAEIIDMEKINSSEWIDNVISFKKATMKEVLDKLSLWYGVEFDVKDSNIYDFSYTLYSDDMLIDTILHNMEMLSPVRFKRTDNRIEVTENRDFLN